MYEVQLDGCRQSVFFDPQPDNYELAGVFRYAETQPLIVFVGGGWIETTVKSISFGNLHDLRKGDAKKKTFKMSLNELNHTPAKLKLATYDLHASKYCEDLWTSCSHIPDGLTCRRLDLLALPFAVISGKQAENEGEDSSQSAESGDTSEDSDDSDLEGTDARTLEPHEEAWQELMRDIAPITPKVREAGAISRRAVLVLGKPASGKTTLMRRLVLEMLIASGGGCVPLLLEASEIVATIYHPCGYCVEGDVLDALLQKRHSTGATYMLLWQALYSRRVIIFVDGADENDSGSWEALTHYLHYLTSIGHPVVLLARPSLSRFRWHMRDHFAATSSYRIGQFSKPLQRLAAARLPGPAAETFMATFQPCETLCRHPGGLALLLSQAELRFAARLAPTKAKELSTDLLTQLVETAIPHLITFHLSACLPDGAAALVAQVLEVMAMKLFIDGGDLLLPEAMQRVLDTEHPDLTGSWPFVESLITAGQFILVEPCLPSFHDERRGKMAMRFAPLPLRDFFLARCFTRYIGEKRVLGLPPAEDIIFDSDWNLFFDFLIELAATSNVCVTVDLSKKPVLSEANLANFTARLRNLQTPVIEMRLPPNQDGASADESPGKNSKTNCAHDSSKVTGQP
ncbi:unnamed protein product [Symbiodinium natans]|uniref:NACHT domain-containing protein n=1 Tax=Symbiodinium natans TaxID=878477 RepID=A0A812PC60_9DINO|nr:unnamed protein product [Symbiodinium natans]